MVTASAPYCLRYPEGTHVEIASLTMLKTVITTCQGASAIFLLIIAVSGIALPGFAIGFGVDTVFFPLAILGLLRLCAAPWLTEDFVYQGDGLRNTPTTETATQAHRNILTKDNDIELDDSSRVLDPLITTTFETAGFKSPAHSWRSRFFRIFFLLLLGGVWVMALLIAFPLLGETLLYTTTTFLLGVFYVVFIGVSLVLYAIYFFRGQTTITVLPCISSTWYRIYTLLLMGFMLALIIIASIEMNKDPAGRYTSADLGVRLACQDSSLFWRSPSGNPDSWAGVATNKKLEENGLTNNQTGLPVKRLQETGPGSTDYWLYNFTGYCLGDFQDM
jgi:hypothetical protein